MGGLRESMTSLIARNVYYVAYQGANCSTELFECILIAIEVRMGRQPFFQLQFTSYIGHKCL